MAQTLFGTFRWKIGPEHEGSIRAFLSKKRNTTDDLAAVLQTTCLEQQDLSYRSIKRF